MRSNFGLLTTYKVFEKLLSELIISDMKDKFATAQYGNQRENSIQQYLVKTIHRILTAVDNNARRYIFAVVVNIIDWNSAFVQ